jgi:hypothetical protein
MQHHPARLVLLLAVSATSVALCASPASARVPTGTVPVAIGTPTIYGALLAGSTLFATSGTWAGSPASYRYTWVRCDRTGSSCSPPVGGLNRYLVPPSAVGSTLKVTVTGWNVRGTGSTSVLSGVVDAVAPLNLASPSVSGKTAVGATLTVAPGRWSGSLPQTVTYEWRMGFVINDTYVWKPGVTTGRTYVVPKESEGARFEVSVTVTNAAGSRDYTILTPQISGVAPTNTVAPALTGGLAAGTMLSLSTGTWTGSPTSWQHAWARCDRNGNACVPIPPDSQSWGHGLLVEDIGHTLKATVTVGSTLGTRSASVLSGIVTAPAPGPIAAAPGLLGAPTFTITRPVAGGLVVTATPGSWGGHPSGTCAFRWESSTDSTHWVPIAGAVTAQLTLVAPMLGSYVRVVVTATDSAGSATATSVPLTAR